LKFSIAAMKNGGAIAEDARVLAAESRFARATALMVTAREELGKAWYAFLLGVGAVRPKPDSMQVLSRRHQMKQMLGELHAPQEIVDWMQGFIQHPPEIPDPDCLDDAAGEALGRWAGEVKRSVEAGGFNEQAAKAIGLRIAERWNWVVEEGLHERLRQTALYVDLDAQGQVGDPSRVTCADFLVQEEAFTRMWEFLMSTNALAIDQVPAETLRSVMVVVRRAFGLPDGGEGATAANTVFGS